MPFPSQVILRFSWVPARCGGGRACSAVGLCCAVMMKFQPDPEEFQAQQGPFLQSGSTVPPLLTVGICKLGGEGWWFAQVGISFIQYEQLFSLSAAKFRHNYL